METEFSAIAIAVGLSSMAVAVAATVQRAFSGWRNAKVESHALELCVDNQRFVINVGAIDKEDPAKIARALQAIRSKKSAA